MQNPPPSFQLPQGVQSAGQAQLGLMGQAFVLQPAQTAVQQPVPAQYAVLPQPQQLAQFVMAPPTTMVQVPTNTMAPIYNPAPVQQLHVAPLHAPATVTIAPVAAPGAAPAPQQPPPPPRRQQQWAAPAPAAAAPQPAYDVYSTPYGRQADPYEAPQARAWAPPPPMRRAPAATPTAQQAYGDPPSRDAPGLKRRASGTPTDQPAPPPKRVAHQPPPPGAGAGWMGPAQQRAAADLRSLVIDKLLKIQEHQEAMEVQEGTPASEGLHPGGEGVKIKEEEGAKEGQGDGGQGDAAAAADGAEAAGEGAGTGAGAAAQTFAAVAAAAAVERGYSLCMIKSDFLSTYGYELDIGLFGRGTKLRDLVESVCGNEIEVRFPASANHAAVFAAPGVTLKRVPPATSPAVAAAAALAAAAAAAAASPAAKPGANTRGSGAARLLLPQVQAQDLALLGGEGAPLAPQRRLDLFLRRRLAPARMRLRWRLEAETHLRRAQQVATAHSARGARHGGAGGGANGVPSGQHAQHGAGAGDAGDDELLAALADGEDGAPGVKQEDGRAAGGEDDGGSSMVLEGLREYKSGSQLEAMHVDGAAAEQGQDSGAGAHGTGGGAGSGGRHHHGGAQYVMTPGEALDAAATDPGFQAEMREVARGMALDWGRLVEEFEGEYPEAARELWKDYESSIDALRDLMTQPQAPPCLVGLGTLASGQQQQQQRGAEGVQDAAMQQQQPDGMAAPADQGQDAQSRQQQSAGQQQQQQQQRVLIVPTLTDSLSKSSAAWTSAPPDPAGGPGAAAGFPRRAALVASHTPESGRDVAWLGRAVSKLRVLLLDYTPLAAEPLATPARPGLPLLPEGPSGGYEDEDEEGGGLGALQVPTCVVRDLHAAVGLEAWRLAELGFEGVEQMLGCPVFEGAFVMEESGGRK